MIEFEKINQQNKLSVLGIYQKIYSTNCDTNLLLEIMDKPSHIGFLVYSYNHLVAFISANFVLDELDIIDLGVISEYRRMGVADKLIRQLKNYCIRKNIKRIFLEVEENNVAAINLYEKTGFNRIGIRKNYYSRKGILIDGLAYCWNSMC